MSWFPKAEKHISKPEKARGIYSLDGYSGASRVRGVGWATLPPKALRETLFASSWFLVAASHPW